MDAGTIYMRHRVLALYKFVLESHDLFAFFIGGFWFDSFMVYYDINSIGAGIDQLV